jgi:hypothetical protein
MFLVGVQPDCSAWRLWDSSSGLIYVASTVALIEHKVFKHVANITCNAYHDPSSSSLLAALGNDVSNPQELSKAAALLDVSALASVIAVDPATAENRHPNPVPDKFGDIANHPEHDLWLRACNEEIRSLKTANTWKIVARPRGHPVITARWVFRNKLNAFGVTVCRKA